jgi:hypothetical protein
MTKNMFEVEDKSKPTTKNIRIRGLNLAAVKCATVAVAVVA